MSHCISRTKEGAEILCFHFWASLVAQLVKNPSTCNAGDAGLIPELGSPGEGHGNPFQDSSLKNPMDRGVLWAMVPRTAQSQTCLEQLGTHTPQHHTGFRGGTVVKNLPARAGVAEDKS